MKLIGYAARPREGFMSRTGARTYNGQAMRFALFFLILVLLAGASEAAPRQHTVLLGKWRMVEARSETGAAQETRVRELVIDGRLREYLTGPVHEVTERLFVVRRAYRM